MNLMKTESADRNIFVKPEILESFHYSSIEEAGVDMLMLSAQAKYAEYLAENRHFESKYQTEFISFRDMINREIGKEDFEREDDLMAWQFAYEGLRYWIKKIEELRHCFSKH